MNTRKLRWLSHDDIVVNLDNVSCFFKSGNGVTALLPSHKVFLAGTTIDDIRHYLKYGKPKKRR